MQSIEDITEILEDNADVEYAEAMEAYMKGKFTMYGIKSPKRRALTKDFIRDSKKLDIDEVVLLIDDLWDYDERDYQMIGLDLMIANKRKFTDEHIEVVESWILRKSWWDTIDMIVTHVVGQLGLRHLNALEPYLERWLASDNIWLNRTCLIYQLKYGKDVDLARLFDYIRALNHKKEFFVQKAIGWSLRQASKSFPSEVKAFITNHELSNLAIREGSKYL